MILVRRTGVAPPAPLLQLGASALKKLEAQYLRTEFAQQDPDFRADIYTSATVVETLAALFESKCAFCESRISSPSSDHVEHFRPRTRARSANGDVARIHYWWLAYAWENLYLACVRCRTKKANHFPIGAVRAEIGTRGDPLRDEEPLLLDPCFDTPEGHLSYKPRGLLAPLTHRGEVTIEVLQLNRPDLVKGRATHAERVRTVLPQFMAQGLSLRRLENALYRHFSAARRDGLEFFGLTKQMAAEAHTRSTRKAVKQPVVSAASTVESRDWGQLDRIEIDNFRAIQHLQMRFPELAPATSAKLFGSDEQEPWIVLLGNNGIGKSSVLKAIALALASPEERLRSAPHPEDLVTQGIRARKGRVRLWFSNRKEPHEWVFGEGVQDNPPRPPVGPVLGYGSTRLLPSSKLPASGRAPRIERIGNLFSAIEPLSDAEEWLASESKVSAENFDLLATDLKQLLALESRDVLQREGKRLLAHLYRKTLPVRELSDGFQSVLALTLDMMFNLSATTHDVRNVPALVLLDEIEVHLHPTWKIRIVHDLRRMFRRSRFIVTTHDPLCVQGLAPGELHVMTRKERTRRVEAKQVDVPLGLRSDQVLTGEWFGMGSTRDPDTLARMERHSQLLLVDKRTPQQEAEKVALEETLRQRLGRFAESPYEQAGLRAYAELAPKRGTVVSEVEDKDKLAARTRALFNQKPN